MAGTAEAPEPEPAPGLHRWSAGVKAHKLEALSFGACRGSGLSLNSGSPASVGGEPRRLRSAPAGHKISSLPSPTRAEGANRS